MKLFGYTCTFNEAEMIPYVMPFVERMGYDKFVVYDNESTDNTVEELSKYPFVEIRTFKAENESWDEERCTLHLLAYQECFIFANQNNEEVWMSWTDFDEVIYNMDFTGTCFKSRLEGVAKIHPELNYFSEQMINLLPPPEYRDMSLSQNTKKINNILSTPGLRATMWDFGHKPLLVKVNDIYYMETSIGNHAMWVTLPEGKKLYDLNEILPSYAFHLKYIDKNALKKKTYTYTQKNCYNDIYRNIENIYDELYSTSFPLEQYFALKTVSYNEKQKCLFQIIN